MSLDPEMVTSTPPVGVGPPVVPITSTETVTFPSLGEGFGALDTVVNVECLLTPIVTIRPGPAPLPTPSRTART